MTVTSNCWHLTYTWHDSRLQCTYTHVRQHGLRNPCKTSLTLSSLWWDQLFDMLVMVKVVSLCQAWSSMMVCMCVMVTSCWRENSSKSFIVTLICFVVGRITKENAFICFRFKFAKLFIIILNIAFASKTFEMFYWRSLTILELMRSLSVVHLDICFLENKNRSKCSFTPEGCGSSRLIKHSTSHLLNCSVHPFHHSIFLRSPSCREFPSYSMFFTEIEKFIWGKLPTSVRPEALNFVIRFVFSQGFERFEFFECFVFVLHKSQPNHPGEVINE